MSPLKTPLIGHFVIIFFRGQLIFWKRSKLRLRLCFAPIPSGGSGGGQSLCLRFHPSHVQFCFSHEFLQCSFRSSFLHLPCRASLRQCHCALASPKKKRVKMQGTVQNFSKDGCHCQLHYFSVVHWSSVGGTRRQLQLRTAGAASLWWTRSRRERVAV